MEDADPSNFDNSTFLLITNETPVANNPGFNFFGILVPHYIDCESGPTYDLTFLDDSIIGNQEGSFIVSYFENEQDANNNVNAIANPENYDLQSNVNTLFTTNLVARIQFADGSSCFDTTSFTFSTYQSNNNDFDSTDITKCANEDGTAVFDLTETLVVNNNNLDIANRNYDVFDEEGNQIGNNIFNEENYPTNTFEELSIEIRNIIRLNPNITGFCVNIEAFTIQAFENPQVEVVQDIIACSANDEETTFNLTLNDDLVIGNQEGSYNITYHFTLPEANAGINSVTDAGFDPTVFNLDNFQQFMFVRIENALDPSCFSVDFFTLQDSNNIIANEPQDTDFCTLPGETSLTINLTDYDDEVNATPNLNEFVVNYFIDDELIQDPTSFLVTDQITSITAILSDANFGDCFDEVNFDLTLNTSPEIDNLNNLEICANSGFDTSFDLTVNTAEALGSQNANDFSVAYFNSLQDAENNTNSLQNQGFDISNYITNAAVETIFIRLQNINSDNCFVIDAFDLQTFPVEVNPITPIEECINAETQLATFDLTEFEAALFGENQDATTHSILFLDENASEIANPENYTIASSQTISVEISNLENLSCFETTSINLIALAEDNPDCTLGTNLEAAFKFKTYPNPVSSQLNIESNEPISKIEVFTVNAKKVMTKSGNQIKDVNFSNFPLGIYLLKLEVGNRSQMTKIIKK